MTGIVRRPLQSGAVSRTMAAFPWLAEAVGHSAKSAPVHDEERDHEGDADQGYNEDGPEVARLSDHRVELDDVL